MSDDACTQTVSFDVSDKEWSLVVPYLVLMREDTEQRHHAFRNGLRYVIRYGIIWRAMPNDLTPWSAVYQQSCRWIEAGCFDAFVSRACRQLASDAMRLVLPFDL